MPTPPPARRYRFGVFEADATSGELRKHGIRIKVTVQPFQVLLLLLQHPGEILTREDIARELWPDGTFVDYDHGVNSAINRIREALGDTARNPRFIETLARRGYRFIAPVQTIDPDTPGAPSQSVSSIEAGTQTDPQEIPHASFLAAAHDLPPTPHRTVRTLFILLQLMYLGYYVGALANLSEITDLFRELALPADSILVLIVTAAILIPARIFLVSAVAFQPPRLRATLLRMWPFLLPFDVLWALAPFLLLHHINAGVALACTAPLVYSPFAQRALILMGAANPKALHPQ